MLLSEDTMSQRSDSSKSTSGCSSMIPQAEAGPSREQKRKASGDTNASTSPAQEQPVSKRQKCALITVNSAILLCYDTACIFSDFIH